MDGLKQRIEQYLKNVWVYDKEAWTHKSKIEDLAKNVGFLGNTASRRCRELVEENKIEHRPKGNSQEYKYLPDISDLKLQHI